MKQDHTFMKAYAISKYGKYEKVRETELPIPQIGDSDILINVRAASVNPLDLKIISGGVKPILSFTFPLVLGNDVAGVVERVGTNVTNFVIGDEVYARTDSERIGSFAEYTAVQASVVALKPKNLTMQEAASVPLVGLTAWQVFVEMAHVQPGQKVLIHAGSGGVGTFAIQLAKHLGAFVATTASEASRELVTKLGADKVIDYRTEDFSKLLSGYDLVLDTQGGETLKKSLTVLKPGGKVISLAGPPDHTFAKRFGLNPFLQIAMFLLSYDMRSKAKKLGVEYMFHFMGPSGSQLAEISKLLESGAVHPVIDKVFSFDQTPEALDYAASGRAKGKIVVDRM